MLKKIKNYVQNNVGTVGVITVVILIILCVQVLFGGNTKNKDEDTPAPSASAVATIEPNATPTPSEVATIEPTETPVETAETVVIDNTTKTTEENIADFINSLDGFRDYRAQYFDEGSLYSTDENLHLYSCYGWYNDEDVYTMVYLTIGEATEVHKVVINSEGTTETVFDDGYVTNEMLGIKEGYQGVPME